MNLSEANDTFTPDFRTFYHGVTALLACNLLVGLPANVYVVWHIAGGAGRTLASEIFAFSLAISEILFCIWSFYFMIHFLLGMPADVGTVVLECMSQFMFISRPTFQSCICVERYLAVVHPVVFLRLKPLRYRLAWCVVDWLLMLLYCVIPAFHLSTIHLSYALISKSLFFLVVMLYCGVRVLCVLKQPGPGDGDGDRESRNSIKRKAFKVIMITLVFTSTTQFLQVFILGPTVLYASQQAVLQVTLVSLSINIVSVFITPLLYLHRVGKLPCIKF
ncbi:proteinase-activated receptor 3 [Micropterus salmoides]|uniref:proteinase-activated receptor 3 n=1 Tax=Micropterus salmoides TaxID=27706 RepID=UPI0018EDA364|nr:proteinase-activated receptor 3 [Micropterus salmoides]